MSNFHFALPEPDFLALMHQQGKFKLRSDQTHDSVHVPQLESSSAGPIRYLLLGDSMLERFQTTGSATAVGRAQFPRVFNAGVGGDGVANVLFRVGKKGLFARLKERSGGVTAAVLLMGTNDLRRRRPLSAEVVANYAVVMEALDRAAPGCVFVVAGITPRTDVEQSTIDASNDRLEELVEEFNSESESSRAHFLPPLPEINTTHLVDHVHLTEQGYSIFARGLEQKLAEIGVGMDDEEDTV